MPARSCPRSTGATPSQRPPRRCGGSRPARSAARSRSRWPRAEPYLSVLPPRVTSMSRCWINTVSREHVLWGVEGGYTQADHGKNTRLRQLAPGDTIAFYSPRTEMRGGEPLQEFTALATVTGDEVFQVEMTPEFHPGRLAV